MSEDARWVCSTFNTHYERGGISQEESERLSRWLEEETDPSALRHVLSVVQAPEVLRMIARFGRAECFDRHTLREASRHSEPGVIDGVLRNSALKEESLLLFAERLMDRVHDSFQRGGARGLYSILPLVRTLEGMPGALDPAELEVMADKVLRSEGALWLPVVKEMALFRGIGEERRSRLWKRLGAEADLIRRLDPPEMMREFVRDLLREEATPVEVFRALAESRRLGGDWHAEIVLNVSARRDEQVRSAILAGRNEEALESLVKHSYGEELRVAFRRLVEVSPAAALRLLEGLAPDASIGAQEVEGLLRSDDAEIRLRAISQVGRWGVGIGREKGNSPASMRR